LSDYGFHKAAAIPTGKGCQWAYYVLEGAKSDLKFITVHDNLLLNHKGGGFMKGSYHYDPKAKRYFVKIYPYQRVWRYNGEPIWHE
jgi:hypothetical protein